MAAGDAGDHRNDTQLVLQEALAQGLRPVLGGRDAQKLGEQCREHGLEPRVFSTSDGPAVDAALEDMTAVIHCAGPFAHTYNGASCVVAGAVAQQGAASPVRRPRRV